MISILNRKIRNIQQLSLSYRTQLHIGEKWAFNKVDKIYEGIFRKLNCLCTSGELKELIDCASGYSTYECILGNGYSYISLGWTISFC